MTKKAVSIALIIVGAMLLFSTSTFALDNSNWTGRRGLEEEIWTALGLLIGVSTEIEGWAVWNKNDSKPRDLHKEGYAMNDFASTYTTAGDPRKAIKLHNRALVIFRKLRDRRGEAMTLNYLGIAQAALGNAYKAFEYNLQALTIFREIGDRRGEAASIWNLGLAYQLLGDWNKAVQAMQICVDIEREIGDLNLKKDAAELEALRKKLSS